MTETDDEWTGKFPVTFFVLSMLRHKRATEGHAALSADERVLLTACEFWLAAKRGTLWQRYGTQPAPALNESIYAFSRLGAPRIVSSLRQLQDALRRRVSIDKVARAARLLTEQLAQTDVNVEGLIAVFADKLVNKSVSASTRSPQARNLTG